VDQRVAGPTRGGAALVALIYVGWASTWPVGKYALSTWTPLGLTAVRHAVAGSLLVGWALALGHRPAMPGWRELRVGLLQFCAYYALSYAALETGTSYATAAAAGVYPVLVMLATAERPSGGRAVAGAASALAAIGVGLLYLDAGGLFAGGNGRPIRGMALAVGASVAMAAAVLTPRGHPSPTKLANTAGFVGQSMWCGSAATCVLALARRDAWIRGPFGWQAAAAFAWLSVVGSALVFVGVEWVVRRYGAWRASMAYAAVPALVAMMGAVLLGERPGAVAALALLVTLASLALAAKPS
jgi:drug/metabolite transporter (DMT)-like permease